MVDWTFSILARVSVTFLKKRSAWASMLVRKHFLFLSVLWAVTWG